MGRISKNLISRLHSVYNKDEKSSLALRINRTGGVSWSITGYELTLTSTGKITHWSLPNYSLTQLATALRADGYTVPFIDPTLQHLNASILLEGSGVSSTTNGDHLNAYTSLTYAIFDAMGPGFELAKTSITTALRQMILPQSSAEWADLFGEIFFVPRLPNEVDATYTQRIIEEVKRERSNPVSIIKNVERTTGYHIEMREPWMEIQKLSDSPMDGDFHLQGGGTWQYHIAQPLTRAGIDWDVVMPQVHQDRPAGTLLIDPATHYPPRQITATDHSLTSWREMWRSSRAWLLDGAILSHNDFLSDTYCVINHPFLVSELWTFSADSPAVQRGIYPPETFILGENILSDQHPLGTDLNARFAGFYLDEIGGLTSLSGDLSLSDYRHVINKVPVESWTFNVVPALMSITVKETLESGRTDLMVLAAALPDMYPNAQRGWTGSWNAQRWADPTINYDGKVTSESLYTVETGNPMVLSDFGALSDYVYLTVQEVTSPRETGLPVKLSVVGALSDYQHVITQ